MHFLLDIIDVEKCTSFQLLRIVLLIKIYLIHLISPSKQSLHRILYLFYFQRLHSVCLSKYCMNQGFGASDFLSCLLYIEVQEGDHLKFSRYSYSVQLLESNLSNII